MDQTHCPACLDLEYDLFEPKHAFCSHPPHNSSAKYRAVKFADLKPAASSGCQNCIILVRGTSLFWGSHPEEWTILGANRKALLVLESNPGKSLLAFLSLENEPCFGLHIVNLRTEFPSQDRKSPRNRVDYKSDKFFFFFLRWTKTSSHIWKWMSCTTRSFQRHSSVSSTIMAAMLRRNSCELQDILDKATNPCS